MWAIRILSGPQAGQIFPLKGGEHRLGRGSTCELKINSDSVSKEHASVLVTGDKMILSDLNSRNGTFVNGVRVQNQRLDLGDKISLHDVLLDVLQVPNDMHTGQPMMPHNGAYAAPPPAWAGNAAVQLHRQGEQAAYNYSPSSPQSAPYLHAMEAGQAAEQPAAAAKYSANSVNALLQNVGIYIDNVAMPGVYSLVKTMPFRYALMAMVAIYVLIVTALSTIPVVNTTKQNIKQESIRRAKTIARNMAANNRLAVISDNDNRMDVRQSELEEGVTTAVIIRAKDGTIMAPANRRGDFVNKPFVNKARREEKEVADFIDDSNLGVSVPISVYSAESGNQTIVAYAIILYDMGSLAINASQTFSLFIQTLFIALLVGFILYFFLFKIVEQPIDALNGQLDEALREGREDIGTEYQYSAIERLISNINSALSRIDRSGNSAQEVNFTVNRDIEAANVVNMLSLPGIAVNAIDDRVVTSNEAFDRLIGGGVNLTGQPLTAIPDVALQENLRDLIPQMRANVSGIATGEIPFAGAKYQIKGHAVLSGNDPAYFLMFIIPSESSG